jgi:hypothetical protein
LGGEESPGVLFVRHAEISSISTRKEDAMGRSAKTHWPLLALAAGVALLTLGANGCPPYPLEPGTDCWHTETGTQQRFKTLPAGFFGEVNGEKSNPVINPLIELTGNVDPADVEDLLKKCGCPEKVEYEVSWLDRHGNPVDPDSKHRVQPGEDADDDG